VVVPVPAPTLKVVAAPAKFTVVAVVLIKLKLELGVVRLVVIAGLVIAGVAPKLVRLLAVTPLANVLPVSVPAAAVTVISELPLKLTPLMLRAVVSVAADPFTDPVIVFVTDRFVKVPTLVRLLAVTPDARVFPVSVPAAAAL